MPDAHFREELRVRDGKIDSLQGRSVGRGDIQNHVLQVFGIASKPVLQALYKDTRILHASNILCLSDAEHSSTCLYGQRIFDREKCSETSCFFYAL